MTKSTISKDLDLSTAENAYLDKDETKVEVAPAQDEVKDVWGDLDENGPNYRGLGWMRATVILMKVQIGLGVLAMPSNLATLGMGPGLVVICVVGLYSTCALAIGWLG
jgi:hypothetical protein